MVVFDVGHEEEEIDKADWKNTQFWAECEGSHTAYHPQRPRLSRQIWR